MLLLLACVTPPPAEPAPTVRVIPFERVGVGLSDEVARVVDRYPLDGSYTFYWPPDDGVWWGTTRDVRYVGLVLSPADPLQRSHCVGLTWEVAMEVLQAEAGDGAINGLSLTQMLRFRRDWFVRELGGAGPADAVVQAGIGVPVPREALRRGDFLQMWSVGGGGHSGVFDRWERDGDEIVGVRYWSTHPALGGIGYHTDSFRPPFGLDPEKLYGARLARRDAWVAAR